MSSPEPAPAVRWIEAVPRPPSPPPAAAALRIELALAGEPGALAGTLPLWTLADHGRFSRIVLARLADAAGRSTRLLACKLQRDVYRGVGGAASRRLDNREVEAMWRRERERLQHLAGDGAPEVLAIGVDALPPMAVDTATGRVFRVPAPGSFAPLALCRDDDRLRDAGLQPWSTSLVRYLAAADAPDTFYCWPTPGAAVPARLADGVRVVQGAALYTELVRSFRDLPAARREAVAAAWPDLGAALADCPVEAAAHRLLPLCFYPAELLLLGLQDVRFDEFCDLAGGADAAAVAATAQQTDGPARSAAFARLVPALAADSQWASAPFVGGEPNALQSLGAAALRRLALEATFLKLHAFRQVTAAVRRFHAATGQPHLGVSPDNVMLRFHGGTAAPAPARWCFAATLVDVGCCQRVVLQGLGDQAVPELFRPTTDVARDYVSPLVDLGRAVPELSVRATAMAEPGPEGPGDDGDTPVRVRLRLRTAHDRFDGSEPGDLLQVLADAPIAALGSAALLGVVDRIGDDRRALEAVVTLPPGAAAPERELQFAATASCHRRLQAPSDLHPLGMLLARALLCHDQRDLDAVRTMLQRILERHRLDLEARAIDAAGAERAMLYLLELEHAQLGSECVLFPAALRQRLDAPLPPDLWRDTLLLLTRLLSAQPAFAFARHHGDVPPAGPEAVLDAVLDATDGLLIRLRDELDDRERSEDFAAVAVRLRAQLTASMAADGGAS